MEGDSGVHKIVLALIIIAAVYGVYVVVGELLRDNVDLADFGTAETENSGSTSTDNFLQQFDAAGLTTHDGEAVLLSDLEGTPLVLNAWASWCLFCIEELPDFVAVQQTFGEQVQIVAINRRESAARANEFIGEVNLTQNDLTFLLDPSDTFYTRIGGFSMPETLFISSSGRVVEHHRGPLTEEQITEKVRNAVDSD